MGNARNLANLLSGGDTQITAADLDDDSITADKLASASVTNAKVSNSTLDATTKFTGTFGVAQGGSGLTSLGTSGQGLKVNDAGTALEFGDVSVDLSPIQKDIAILSLTDNLNQNRGFHNLSNAITDTYENETQVTAKSNVALQSEGFGTSFTASPSSEYATNIFGTTGTISTADGKSFNAVTVTTGTGAWESGGTSHPYIDITTSAVGAGYSIFPQGTTYDFSASKVVFTYQVITKGGGSGPGFGPTCLKGVATDWVTYHAGRDSGTTELYGNPDIFFYSQSSVGNQSRFTYDPLNTPNEVDGETRATNSGTWTGHTNHNPTEDYGTSWTSLSPLATGMVYGFEGWKDSGNNWTVRMWALITPGAKTGSGSYTSTTNTVTDSVSEMSCVIVYKNQAGTATLNTDLKVSLSADNGSNFTEVTLTATNTSAIATNHITATSNKVTVTAGTQLKYKVEFANQSSSKDTRIQGISMIF